MIRDFLGIFVLALALPLSSHALTSDSALGEFQTQPVRLACGESQDVWAYISFTMGGAAHKDNLPVVSEESARYFIDYADGSWIMAVEYVALRSERPNFMCIIAKGGKDKAIESMGLPVNALPREIISPRRLQRHRPQFTINQ